ncbi:MAG: helix-turn-helix domain-containing protein [Bacteroidales bacterium]|nr:helix-turn-helix domain-containing protein [Bacteroidales bacterium]
MITLGYILRHIREEKQLPLQLVSESSGIDVSLLSKIETGKRIATTEQVLRLAKIYGFEDATTLLVQQQSDEIVSKLNNTNQDIAIKALQAAQAKVTYGSKYLSLFAEAIFARPIALESRRYIGSKAKLIDWIMSTIKHETRDVNTFFDVFAGTGVVTKAALSNFDYVFTNDFLHSNNIIYKAFFGPGDYDENKIGDILDSYNELDPDDLPQNYFSENFGDKYFEMSVAKLVGHIREDIEKHKSTLTEKEYCILIATLIYNIDKLANTVGHFEAYIKKPIKHRPLRLRMIEAEAYDNIEIFKQDANELARSLHADVAYIDPPYNSRQYCRFYHVYETLVKWDKPQLFGVAMKPAPENMSRYCTTKAYSAFEDLIANLNVRYIAVSYNNTYNSKSSSSENKISLEQIRNVLERCGDTHMYECSHRFFNAGKTDFNDHKELLFITTVDEEFKRKSFASILCR